MRVIGSIREFCDLKTPIFMFNIKDEYAVMTISEVRIPE